MGPGAASHSVPHWDRSWLAVLGSEASPVNKETVTIAAIFRFLLGGLGVAGTSPGLRVSGVWATPSVTVTVPGPVTTVEVRVRSQRSRPPARSRSSHGDGHVGTKLHHRRPWDVGWGRGLLWRTGKILILPREGVNVARLNGTQAQGRREGGMARKG